MAICEIKNCCDDNFLYALHEQKTNMIFVKNGYKSKINYSVCGQTTKSFGYFD